MSLKHQNRLNIQSFSSKIHDDLLATKELIYNPHNLKCSELQVDAEGDRYGACAFKLNNLSIRFRVAKITPKKIGQFVTLWQRIEQGKIQPFDISENVDFVVISTRQGDNFGQFVFPKSILFKKKILSKNNVGGKLAIRVYPSWDRPTNKQAQITQKWQLEYFLEVQKIKPLDCARVSKLYCTNS